MHCSAIEKTLTGSQLMGCRSAGSDGLAHLDPPNPLGFRPRNVWPPAVGAALGKGSEEGGRLHNIAASLQMPSPEFEDLPTIALGVPVFSNRCAT